VNSEHQTIDRAAEASRTYRLAPEVVLVSVADGSARVLDLAGQSFALSEVAARMLADTLELGPEAAARAAASRWGIDLQQAATDLGGFLGELLNMGLLVPAGQPDPKPRCRARLGSMLVATLVRFTSLSRRTLKGRARGLLAVANLSCRWLGWGPTVRLWHRMFPKAERLLQGDEAEEACRAVDVAVRQALADSAFWHACKERGLTSWAIARWAGLAPTLTLGFSLCPFHGHCWAQIGETFLADEAQRCIEYQFVRTYE
jgi:hypothetical protein